MGTVSKTSHPSTVPRSLTRHTKDASVTLHSHACHTPGESPVPDNRTARRPRARHTGANASALTPLSLVTGQW